MSESLGVVQRVLPAVSPQHARLRPQPVARPFLRWAGGKTRLLQHLRPHFPPQFANYYEPFLGGGAVFFDAGHQTDGVAVLADLNAELVNVWRVVREEPLELFDAVALYQGKDTEGAYYEVRNTEPPAEPIERAARFLYLNQTAWNGLWRVNRWGRFNVPWGARPFRGIAKEHLLAVSGVLAHADLRVADFRDVLADPRPGDFVYLDPPYLPISDTSKFHGYTEKRFRRPDLVELGAICADLTARGVHWVLSNRDTPLVRDVFNHAEIVALTARRSVAAQNRRDVEPSASPEVIVIGKP